MGPMVLRFSVRLVEGKGISLQQQSYEEIVADISREGINVARASAIFAILRESATTQCVECGAELSSSDLSQSDNMDVDGPPAAKRGPGRQMRDLPAKRARRCNVMT